MNANDLHQHFKVAYDKENVITAYPSFEPEEIDVFLNNAYKMVINQKFTGNNTRKVAFEGDNKRIEDLQNLVITTTISDVSTDGIVPNAISFDLETVNNFLYYISSVVKLDGVNASEVILTTHNLAQKVKETTINKPWLPRPIAEIEKNNIIIYYDSIDNTDVSNAQLILTYLKEPDKIDIINSPENEIEVNDSVAMEIVNLAVFLALENIESQRVDTNSATLIMQE